MKLQALRKGSDDTEATKTTESKTRDDADKRHTMRLFKTESKDDRTPKRQTPKTKDTTLRNVRPVVKGPTIPKRLKRPSRRRETTRTEDTRCDYSRRKRKTTEKRNDEQLQYISSKRSRACVKKRERTARSQQRTGVCPGSARRTAQPVWAPGTRV